MCGIAGEFHIDGGAQSSIFWSDVVSMMRRRGPDCQNVWRKGDRCVLGSARLSILDVDERASMPMVSSDGKFALSLNGEIYNFREIRRELESMGYVFKTSGDTEVVLYALMEWGVGALDRFNGMFALAFYDGRDGCLLLARDHAGIKPLYFYRHSKGIVFASQYDQILAYPDNTQRELDKDAISMYLRLGYVPSGMSPHKGAEMLSPGCWLRIDKSNVVHQERWFAFPEQHDGTWLRGDDAQELVTEAVERAVRRHMVSDVPVGCFLSGGVDSPLIAACVAENSSTTIPSFTIGLEGVDLDESEVAQRYADELGLDHETAWLNLDNAADLTVEALDMLTEPMADEGIIPTLLVSKIAKKKVTVALSGEGGDEMFWGYYPRQSRIMRGVMPATGEAYLESFSEFTKTQFRRCFPFEVFWPQGLGGYSFSETDTEKIALEIRKTEYEWYLPFILLKTDRASMHHSLEVRVPFLDREVISAASKLHPEDCMDFDAQLGKLPLRKMLSKYLPKQEKIKKGFTIPVDEWVRGPLYEMVEQSVRRLSGFGGIEVDERAMQGLLQKHKSGEENNGMALWKVVVLDYWANKYASSPIIKDARAG